MPWRWIWFGVASMVLALELWAIGNASAGDTLSETVIPLLMAHPVIWRATLLVWLTFAAWIVYHWWFEYRDKGHP